MQTLAGPDDVAALVRRLRSLGPGTPRVWGRMSAPQMVCHLADALRMALSKKPVRSHGTWLDRTLVKWVALSLPMTWPRGITTSAELDQLGEGCTRPAEFAADVAAVEALLHDTLAAGESLARQPHSIFGRMSAAEWRRWAYLHMDHHLRQFGV